MSFDDRVTLAAGGVLIALLYLASLRSYLLFHTLAEIVFVVVCLSVLVVASSLHHFLDDDFALFLGIGLCFVALLHAVHLVDYPGVGMISGSLDPPTQVWLGTRLLLAGTFIAAAFVIGKRVHATLVLSAYAAYTAALLASIYWWRIFPPTLLSGSGLTPFKKVSEYVICLLLVLAIVLLWRRRNRLPAKSYRLLLGALLTSVAAELWFSLYLTAASWPNLVGHLFLVVSALLFFRAVVDDGLARPHILAMSDLREAEALHRRLEIGLMPALPIEREDLSVLSHYRPGEHHLELGGDFIDVLDRGDDGVAVICGDVSGHGPNAAALGAMLRVGWQALTESGADPATVVAGLKAVLLRERKAPTTFATFCLAWIDPLRDEVTLLNVGHPVPLLIARGVTPLPVPPMPPLGTFDWPFENPRLIGLPADWQLFFYTDGLIEGRRAPGSQDRFGERQLIESLGSPGRERLDAAGLEQLITSIEAAGGESFADDVSVMVISRSASQGILSIRSSKSHVSGA